MIHCPTCRCDTAPRCEACDTPLRSQLAKRCLKCFLLTKPPRRLVTNDAIIALRATGMSCREVAAVVGVSAQRVGQIAPGRRATR
jgi:hypothetical protein